MNHAKRQLVLASSSPARSMLLSRLRVSFITHSPDIDESRLADESIDDMLIRLAEAKANTCATIYPNAIIIAADTIGVLDNAILCKPMTHANGVEQLRTVSGKQVRFYTSLCVLDSATQKSETTIEFYDVHFRQLTDDVIHHYLKMENALNCAGCFHAEGLGVALVERFAGNDYTTLIGLPLILLTTMLKHIDVNLII